MTQVKLFAVALIAVFALSVTNTIACDKTKAKAECSSKTEVMQKASNEVGCCASKKAMAEKNCTNTNEVKMVKTSTEAGNCSKTEKTAMTKKECCSSKATELKAENNSEETKETAEVIENK